MTTPSALEDLDWHEDAIATIIGLAHAQHTLTADDLSRELRAPAHGNHVGAAFQAARAAGHITHVGYTTSTRTGRKHSVIRVWTHNTEYEDRTP